MRALRQPMVWVVVVAVDPRRVLVVVPLMS